MICQGQAEKIYSQRPFPGFFTFQGKKHKGNQKHIESVDLDARCLLPEQRCKSPYKTDEERRPAAEDAAEYKIDYRYDGRGDHDVEKAGRENRSQERQRLDKYPAYDSEQRISRGMAYTEAS